MRRPARVWLLAALPVAGTVVVDPSGWSPFGPARWAAVVCVGLAGAALALPGREVRVSRRGLLAWAAFIAWVAVAASAGLDGRLAWVGTPQRHFGAVTWGLCALTWAAGHAIDDEGDLRAVAGVATAVCGAIGAWSAAQLLGWQPVHLAASDRLVGPLGNADYLGAAAVLLVPVAAGVAADRDFGVWWRATAAGCAVLGYVALIGAGARAAWVGLVAAVMCLAWARRPTRLRSHTSRAVPGTPGGRRLPHGPGRLVLGVLSAVAIAAVTVGLGVASGTAGRVPAAFDTGQPGGASRLAEWSVAARVVVAHPLTGVGPEGYRIAFGTAVDPTYQRTYGRLPLPDRAHDSLIDVAATTGLPGVAGYLILLAAVGAFVCRALQSRSRAVAGMAVGLLAYTVGALFLFPIADLEPTVWMLAGALSAHVAAEGDLVRLRMPRLVAPAVLAGVLGVAVLGVRAVGADREMRAALSNPSAGWRVADRAAHAAPGNIVMRLAAARVDSATGTGKGLDRALDEVGAALVVSPADPVARLDRARLLLQRAESTHSPGDWTAAAFTLRTLALADPRNPAVLLPLGVAEVSTGHPTEAIVSWRTAAALDPSTPSPDIDLAVLYMRQHRLAAARQAARTALYRDPGDGPATSVLRELRTMAGGTDGT